MSSTDARPGRPQVWLALFLAWTAAAPAAEVVAKAEARRFPFPTVGVTFDAGFPGARLDACTQRPDGRFQLLIRAETTPINNSAWYAFRVRSEKPQAIEVELTYQGGSHRYPPRISRDGKSWTRRRAGCTPAGALNRQPRCRRPCPRPLHSPQPRSNPHS